MTTTLTSFFSKTWKFIREGYQIPSTVSVAQSDDSEEDGFLVVGQSAADRTRVTASEFTGETDAPPAYDVFQSDNELPTYGDYMSGIQGHPRKEDANLTQSNTCTNNPLTAISDLPFTLSSDVLCTNNLYQLDLTHHTFDWSCYEYDFVYEQTVLRELGENSCREETTENLIKL